MDDDPSAQWFDVTEPLHAGMTIYPGDPLFSAEPVTTVEQHGYAVSCLKLGSHTGTHLDAPRHFLADGASIDALPLDRLLLRPCRVVEFDDQVAIRDEDIASLDLQPGESLLCKTGNSRRIEKQDAEFDTEYVHISPEAAMLLVEKRINLVGIDALSVEGFDTEGFPVHKTLLAADILIIEGLRLHDVTPGRYELFCLPLPLKGLDASPVRVLLRPWKEAI